MADSKLEICTRETYLKNIEDSVGSEQFRSLFAQREGGEVKDILEDGNLSCAYFVSSVLCLFDMIDKKRATVRSLKIFVESDERWDKVSLAEVEPGDLVFYTGREFTPGNTHAHVGFVINNHEAVSTSDQTKAVAKHPLKYHPVESVWRYSWE